MSQVIFAPNFVFSHMRYKYGKFLKDTQFLAPFIIEFKQIQG